MSEEAKPNPQGEPQPSAEDPWQEIGQQFGALGDNIAAAFHKAAEDEQNKRRMREVQSGLEEAMGNLGRVIRDAAASPEGQRAQEELTRAATTVTSASRAAAREAKPHLLSALRQMNVELKNLAERMEGSASSPGDSAPPESPAEPPAG
jgi:hypothetical protein